MGRDPDVFVLCSATLRTVLLRDEPSCPCVSRQKTKAHCHLVSSLGLWVVNQFFKDTQGLFSVKVHTQPAKRRASKACSPQSTLHNLPIIPLNTILFTAHYPTMMGPHPLLVIAIM